MIKEVLLSLAVVAASGVSFVGSPKKSVQLSFPKVVCDLYFTPSNPQQNYYSSLTGNVAYYLDNAQQPNDTATINEVSESTTLDYFDGALEIYWELTNGGQDVEGYIYCNGEALGNLNDISITAGLTDPEVDGYDLTASFSFTKQEDQPQNLSVSFGIAQATYTLTKNFVNCQFAASPLLPNTYASDGQLTYHCTFVSNAGGYGFNNSSITQTGGITVRSINLFDEYGTSGYYASLSFYVDLPLNDCSLTVEAFLPSFSFSSQLNNCTVSPAFPSSISGNFIETYTFTAANGYGFHEDDISWDITNMFIDSVSFSSLLSGNGESGYFYSQVILKLRFNGGGNVLVKVTASPFDVDSYNRGYTDGEKDGYRDGYSIGHRDGEIAGDSYGVWNWLKQAALTTGEFLNIPLLPGFSIGALLTALAGLMIIWLFIKGFLFKS